jgi:peptide deformylase
MELYGESGSKRQGFVRRKAGIRKYPPKWHVLRAIDPSLSLAYLSAMTVRPIITLPDEKILRQVSQPLNSVDASARKLMDDMLETMYDAPGIGLAAIQIGEARRVIVMDTAKDGEEKKPIFLANPEIVWSSEERGEYEEGCLSIPEFFEMVIRPREVRLRYLDRKGEPQELQASGLLATVIQHELDHLNGVLFIDYISKLKRDRVIKKFQKAQKLGKL